MKKQAAELHDVEHKSRAERPLAKIKAYRRKKRYRLVQIDERTWKEVPA